jgi:hypothetical protein
MPRHKEGVHPNSPLTLEDLKHKLPHWQSHQQPIRVQPVWIQFPDIQDASNIRPRRYDEMVWMR